MTDDLRTAVEALRAEVKELDARMQDVEGSQRALARQADAAAETMGDMRRQFSNFVARFDEVSGMLVQHDTDSLLSSPAAAKPRRGTLSGIRSEGGGESPYD